MAIGSSDIGRFSAAVRGNALYALVAVNAVVWIAAALSVLFGGNAAGMLVLPSRLADVLWRPWALATYMFVQTDFLHLLFNMLWLYCFGRIMLMVAPQRRLVATYVGGGLAGAVVFLAVYAAFSGLGAASLMGSSAAVVAVAVAVAFEVPDMPVSLWLIGSVRLKWVVVAMVVFFCAGFTGSLAANAAHAGGAAFGALYAVWLKRRARRASRPAPSPRHELDALLDKVKTSGYDALSRRDKERLFRLSHQLKK